MKKFLFAIIACVGASVALAAGLNFSWTNAVTNTDGSAIPATGPGSLTETRVEYGPCNASRTDLLSVTGTVSAPGTSAVVSTLPPGEWCARARHVNTYGKVSDPSNVAYRVIDAPTPNPPTNFSAG